jgi:predicted ArsR family transcriptional regulator
VADKDTEQLELLPLAQRIPRVPYSDTDTSLEAAAQAVPSAMTDEQRVLAALTERPDTDDGLGRRLRLEGNTLRPRRRSLELKGLVEHSGAYGLTAAGRRAKIWRAVSA